jgi:hypothetical protein
MKAKLPLRTLKALTAFVLFMPAIIGLAPLLAFWIAQDCFRENKWPLEVLGL